MLETRWLLNNESFEFVKNIWSNYISGSYAYQLIMKIRVLQNSLKSWRKEIKASLDLPIPRMLKELEDFQQKTNDKSFR